MHSSCLYIKRYKNGQGGLKFTLIPPANQNQLRPSDIFHRSRSCLTTKLCSFEHQTGRDFKQVTHVTEFQTSVTINTDSTVWQFLGRNTSGPVPPCIPILTRHQVSVRMLWF